MHLPYQHSNIYTFQHNLKTKSDSQIKTDHFTEKTSVPINYRESLDINKVAACYANRAICDRLSPICDYAGSWMIEVKLHPHPICGFCSTFRLHSFLAESLTGQICTVNRKRHTYQAVVHCW